MFCFKRDHNVITDLHLLGVEVLVQGVKNSLKMSKWLETRHIIIFILGFVEGYKNVTNF